MLNAYLHFIKIKEEWLRMFVRIFMTARNYCRRQESSSKKGKTC